MIFIFGKSIIDDDRHEPPDCCVDIYSGGRVLSAERRGGET